jgi:hypothetical protein
MEDAALSINVNNQLILFYKFAEDIETSSFITNENS